MIADHQSQLESLTHSLVQHDFKQRYEDLVITYDHLLGTKEPLERSLREQKELVEALRRDLSLLRSRNLIMINSQESQIRNLQSQLGSIEQRHLCEIRALKASANAYQLSYGETRTKVGSSTHHP